MYYPNPSTRQKPYYFKPEELLLLIAGLEALGDCSPLFNQLPDPQELATSLRSTLKGRI